MTSITIEYFSKKLGISIESLVEKLFEIGIKKKYSDSINKLEQEKLLDYIEKKSKLDKFVFQRKTHTTLNIYNENGKNKSVKVEVRKKHVYLRKILDINSNAYIDEQDNECIYKKENHNKINDDNIEFTTNKIDQYKDKKNRKSFLDKKDIEKIDQQEKLIKQNKNSTKKTVDLLIKEKDFPKKEYFSKNKTDFFSHSKKFKEKENFSQFAYSKDDFSKKSRNKKRNKNMKQKKMRSSFDKKFFQSEENIRYNYRNRKKKSSLSLKQEFKPNITVNRTILIGEKISVLELANKMAVKSAVVIKEIMKLGMIATINQLIDQETAQLIAEEMGHTVIIRNKNAIEKSLISDRNLSNVTKLEKRAPIVTIMGHVNHGKTSLLDKIRSSNIVEKELGGITQNIGAYHVTTKNGSITFLDTPGHSAFSKMRSRGICVTDIMILVVAIDDGVMPQTIESINHAKLNKIPIIVAINKVDKKIPESNQIKNELSKYGIISEEWGGENQFIYISAKYGTGINTLIDAVLLQAEILELKANKHLLAKGTVIESFLDKNLGPTATILIKDGTLKKGNIVLCGCEYGKVRSMYNEFKKEISSAGPSIPVIISGLSGILIPGDEIISVNNERKAREIACIRKEKFREIRLENQNNAKKKPFHMVDKNIEKEVNILLKSNTKGSIDPIKNSIECISKEKIKVKVINSGVGCITENDAIFSSSFNAIIIGFNVKIDPSAQKIIEHEQLTCKNYSTIYDLTTDIEKIIKTKISTKINEKILGLAEVKNIFHTTKTGVVIGCLVTQGKIKKNNKIKIFRKENILYEGKIESLRRFKTDTNEVKNGMECGISIKIYKEICNGDIIKAYECI